MILKGYHRAQIVEHARKAQPNECCGLVAKKDECSVQVFPMHNMEPTPQGFVMDSGELCTALQDIMDLGLELGAIYHSHLDAPPEPSPVDISFAAGWPHVDWIIVGLADDTVKVHSWIIISGQPYRVVVPA